MSNNNKTVSSPASSAPPGAPEQLVARWARFGALAVMGVSGLAILALVVFMIQREGSLVMYGIGVLWLALFAASGAIGGKLLGKRAWAQQTLLAFWELLLIGAVWYLLAGVLFGQGEWWQSRPMMRAGIGVAACLFVGAGGITALLLLASPAGSRLRYSSVVTSSVAIAIALAGAVNIISQHDYVDVSLESYGTHRLSERIKGVVEAVDEPVVLTCVYDRNTPDGRLYGTQTREFLERVAEYGRRHGRNFTVVSAENDTQIRRVDAELRDLIQTEAHTQIAFLQSFVEQGPNLVSEMRNEAEAWNALPANTYLGLWFPGTYIGEQMDSAATELSQQVQTVRSELAAASGRRYPNYGDLTETTRAMLDETQTSLELLGERLAEMSRVPDEINDVKGSLMAQLPELAEARGWVVIAIGEVASDLPEDTALASALRAFVDEAGVVAERSNLLADDLDNLASADSMVWIQGSRDWVIPTSDGRGGTTRMTLADRFRLVATHLDRLAYEAGVMARTASVDDQRQALVDLRQQWRVFDAEIVQLGRAMVGILEDLSTVDPPSRTLLNRARAGTLMQSSLRIIYSLMDQAQAIPPTSGSDLFGMLEQDNIVIVQIGDDVEVIPFEWMWPMALGSGQMARTDSRGFGRTFNGDPVLASKLQMMSQPAFATVMLTYFSPIVSPEQAQFLIPSQIPPGSLTLLATQMIQRNLELRTWNIAEPMADDISFNEAGQLVDRAGNPVVLLILPPPAPSNSQGGPTMMSSSEFRRVADLLNRGVPAVFLTAHLYPQMISYLDEQGRQQSGYVDTDYAWADYLRAVWGVDAMSDYWIVSAIPEETDRTRYTMNWRSTRHLPLNLFTDHPIGQPLRGQRMLWSDLCPVRATATVPAGLTVEPVLVIPSQWGNRMWATPNASEIYRRFGAGQAGTFAPDVENGDLLIPAEGLPVAVAVSRDADSQRDIESGRIVVLGTGVGVTDQFMMAPPMGLDQQGRVVVEDPPYANGDLVVNSLHWALGQEEKIVAGGLERAKPIGEIDERFRITLWVLLAFVLPAAVLGVGVLVMVIRRR